MDMVKCVDGHEMLKGKKFCGVCAKGPADGAEAMEKCGACEGQFLKGANFCSDCGVATTADLDSALETLGTFQKANAARVEELSQLPELDEEELGASAAEGATQLMKSAALRDAAGNPQLDGNGNPDINAMPVITEMLKGLNIQGAQGKKYAEHVLGFLGHIARGQDLLIKSNLALGGEVQRLRDGVDAAGNTSRGVKGTVRALTVAGKTGPGAVLPATEERGPALMLKARAILGEGLTGLKPDEVSLFETYTNGMNASMTEIAADRPLLAQRVNDAFQQAAARRAG